MAEDLAPLMEKVQQTLQPLISKPQLKEKVGRRSARGGGGGADRARARPPACTRRGGEIQTSSDPWGAASLSLPRPPRLKGAAISPRAPSQLLGKPPFRFLHDVFMALINENGFATGLYTDDEKDSGNIKDKQAKLDFLDKMINCVGIVLGEDVDCRSAKIVAGLEPENTNVFLAKLAEAATHPDADSAAAVERALAGERPDPSRPALRGAGGGGGAKDDDGADAKGARDDDAKGGGDAKGMDAPKDDGPPAPAAPKPEGVPASRQGARGDKSEAAPRSGGMGPGFASDMAGGLDDEIEKCTGDFELTIEMLQPLFAKPKLNEKLLSKPPFRFLHDVVMAVVSATGFATGLYGDDETDAKAITEKAQKLQFLEKIVKLVGTQLNTYTTDIKPAKIVSGLEPENTNRLLQLLALAATKAPDSAAAVQLVLSGDEGGAPAKGEPAPAPAAAPEPAPAAAAKSEPPSRGPSPANLDAEPAADAKGGGGDAKGMDAPDDDKGGSAGPVPQLGGGGGGGDAGAKGGDDDGAADGLMLNAAEPKRSTRPTTARRRPPKFASNVKVDEGGGDAKGGAGAGAPGAVPSGIMIDGQATDDALLDDDDDVSPEDANVSALLARAHGGGGAAEGKSKLVQDILKEQQDAKNAGAAGAAGDADDAKKDDKGGIRLGRLKKTGADKNKNFGLTDADLEQLRAAIQVLCQSTNPLGKCMDYVNEDLGLMNRELEKWQAEARKYGDLLEDEKHKTDTALLPLKLQQTEVDEKVKEELAKIASLKAVIHKNDERIQELMNMTIGAR